MNDKVESSTASDGKTGPVGYAVTFIEDMGNGRQVQAAFALKLGAPRAALDRDLDKLRKAMNRQKAYATVRDQTAIMRAEEKMAVAVESSIERMEKETNAQAEKLEHAPKNMHTVERQRLTNVLEQGRMAKSDMQVRLEKHRANATVCQALIDGAKEEIATIEAEIED